ncbi:MAG: trehalose-6-phosphate synthase [Owenweeksia sp.]|nr:trehalose-6-phosphate synthase [Owenweeksia sp.]
MGIDYNKYANSAASPDTLSREVKYRTSLGNHKIMVSMDRLDYSKGIPSRLECFDLFLKQHPEYLRQSFPVNDSSAPPVIKWRNTKTSRRSIDLLVGRINGEYGSVNWTPIHYFYRGFNLHDISSILSHGRCSFSNPHARWHEPGSQGICS